MRRWAPRRPAAVLALTGRGRGAVTGLPVAAVVVASAVVAALLPGLVTDTPARALIGAQAGRYVALGAIRILDTRNGTGGISRPVGPGQTIDVQVTGRGGVPASGVVAVAINVTVVQRRHQQRLRHHLGLGGSSETASESQVSDRALLPRGSPKGVRHRDTLDF